jgi:hypothetical protein
VPGQAFRTVTADEPAAIWPRATLVDVRGREEHATAHIPGSLNILLDELTSRLADLPNGTIYAGLCAHRSLASSPMMHRYIPSGPLCPVPGGGPTVAS